MTKANASINTNRGSMMPFLLNMIIHIAYVPAIALSMGRVLRGFVA